MGDSVPVRHGQTVALRSPLGNPSPDRSSSYVSSPTLAGRGGSDSRRDHNQATGKRAHFQAEPS